MKASRSQLDWVAIQSAWTKSDETVRQIGERHGISHARIHQKAKTEGWGERRGGSGVSPKRSKGNLPSPGNLPNAGGLPKKPYQPNGKSAAGKPPQGKVLAIVREWQKNWKEMARITVEEFNGRIVVRGWSWYRDLKTGELKPTKKGWSVSLNQVESQWIPGLIDAVAKARELGLAGPLIDGDTGEVEE
jgi:hypothetical protein